MLVVRFSKIVAISLAAVSSYERWLSWFVLADTFCCHTFEVPAFFFSRLLGCVAGFKNSLLRHSQGCHQSVTLNLGDLIGWNLPYKANTTYN